MRRGLLVLVAVLAALLSSTASASQLIDRNATGVKLAVNAKGEALLTYTAGGKLKHVLAWGAVNAIAPTHGPRAGRVQARLRGRLGQVPAATTGRPSATPCGAYDGPGARLAS